MGYIRFINIKFVEEDYLYSTQIYNIVPTSSNTNSTSLTLPYNSYFVKKSLKTFFNLNLVLNDYSLRNLI